jgi:hypothetical protein
MRAAELKAQIEKSAHWWRDHGPEVRASSERWESEHNGRRIYESAYREKVLLEEQLNRAAVRNLGLNKTAAKSAPYREKHYVGGERFLDESGRIVTLGDAHDGPLPEYTPNAVSAEREEYRVQAEKEFAEHAEAETGMQMSEAEFQKKKRADVLIRRQTREIADKLEAAGVQAYRSDGFNMFVYWLHSRTVEALPAYRRICLLPYIAAMTRASKLAALEYFLQDNPYARFWTFTTGARCGVELIPERLDWLYRKLRELNKILSRRFGVQIVFRTTEFGTLEADTAGNRCADEGGLPRDETGRVLYHPHAHCVIVSLRGYIRPPEWSAMIEAVNAFWHDEHGARVHWDAGGMVRNARECCKYVCKPGDIIKLSGDELKAFYEATAGRRLVRPMGILADQIRARGKKYVLRRKRIGSRLVWVEALNHNRVDLQDDAEKEAIKNLQDAQEFVEEAEQWGRLAAPSYPGALDGGAPLKRGISADITKVMARIGPAAGPTPFKEPRVLVMSNLDRPCMREVNTHPLVYRLWSQTVESWEAGRAAASLISVHTGTLSGEAFQSDLPAFDPPTLRDPICEPFLAVAT